MSQTFQDKVVIVTGASNGIGASTAALFAEKGAKLACLDIREPDTPATDKRIDIKCNIANEDEVKAAVQKIVDKFGTIDVLCNIAGIADKMERLTDMSNDTINKVMAVNFYGPLYLMRHVIPHFVSKPGETTGEGLTTQLCWKGSIVNVCSVGAVRGGAAGAAYVASKHALLGLSRNTSWMYHKDGVRTNAVLPGGVATNIMGNTGVSLDPLGMKLIGPVNDLRPALVTATDVANAIVFLAGTDGINGAELTVDHGWMAG